MSGIEANSPARSIKRATVVTHLRPEETQKGIESLVAAAKAAGAELQFDAADDANRAVVNGADICFVLGGDGATLRALRGCAGTDVPVFAINFGRIGFLATVDRDGLDTSLEAAFAGEFEVVDLPALDLRLGSGTEFAINEVSFQRRSHLNVTHISYSLSAEEVGRMMPCDGLIAATPVGSTAYNLSVGGPIVAWGVEGFAVSLIAPHALTYRPLVASPNDELSVRNEGDEAIDVVVDGIRTGEIEPGQSATVSFRASAVGLAQVPGSSFYRRFREKLMGLSE